IISGEATGNNFGYSLAAGDFNADGKTDLAVGAYGYTSSTGRAYLFWNDGTGADFGTVACTTGCLAANADAIITGETTSNYFGYSLAAGDFNADGKTDLAVGAYGYTTFTGRAYLFWNDGTGADFGTVACTTGCLAANADAIISGQATWNYFGASLAAGDFNNDGKTDLAVGARGYASNTGRAYLFWNDGTGADFGTVACTTGCLAANADAIITGETSSNYFGYSLAAGDFNNDGKTDLAVGAYGYNSNQGKVYFYTGQNNYTWNLQHPTDRVRVQGATGDELKITGVPSSNFGAAFTAGDFNQDGRADLAVGAPGYNSSQGRVYIFWNDGSVPTSAYSPDVVITGENIGDLFGSALGAADLNLDGKTDLAVGAPGYGSSIGRAYLFYQGNFPALATSASVTISGGAIGDRFGAALAVGVLNYNVRAQADVVIGAPNYSSSTGRAYIFYSDGSYPTTAGTADVTFTGQTAGDQFGSSLAIGDVNANDGLTDLVVGAPAFSSSQGQVYIFNNDGSYPAAGSADVIIAGEAGSLFGASLAVADLDASADGRADLAVGAPAYNSSQGRTYIFNNDGSIPVAAGSADTIITGENAGDQFGYSLAAADFNRDGKKGLAVGTNQYGSSTGRAYVFYNDGSYPAGGSSADVIITGENAGDDYGSALASLDINYDGRIDLAVGASSYNSNQGRVYIYTFNDTVSSGETGSFSEMGTSLVAGDLNADGKIDLAVSAYGYNSSQGRVYIFYNNNGAFNTSAASADKIVSGENNFDSFGFSLATGDLNADGKTDLAVGATSYISGSSQGRVYIFYNGNYPASAASADAKITGENSSDYFGFSLATGDLDADGKTDLAVGAYGYASNSSQGRAYIFYNGNYPASAASADAKITGENSSDYFGSSLATGDLDADGKTDLAVSAYGFPSGVWKSRVYIFYNGNYPASAASADAKITGENNSDYFGSSLKTGDLNADGKTDLAIGAIGFPSGDWKGRVYIFYNGNYPASAASADAKITGENSFDRFGSSLAVGDLNADGKTDLVVGASDYPSSSYQGRAYIFYQGNFTASAASADTKIDGKNNDDYFGHSLASADFNSDGKVDLAVGASGAGSGDGKFYVIISEAASATQAELDQMQTKMKARGTVKFKGNVQVR
ncbi:MAG: FG-GAP-like repeat-containing protein, partial [Parcubacteria group bacterium]